MSKLDEAKTGYTFDDVVLVPQYSEVKSRKDPDITVPVNGFEYKLPVVSAPMSTVTEHDMIVAMWKIGATSVLHRYMDTETQVRMATEAFEKIIDAGFNPANLDTLPPFYAAVGANGDVEERTIALSKAGVTGFCVDVANGHNELSVDAVRRVRSIVPNAKIMAGNVCSYEGAYRLAQAGANSLRVGIGSGCFSGDTRIMMANGSYKNIKDIVVMDRVIGKDGNPVTVVGTRYSGKRKILKYKNNFWYESTCVTGDHLHWIGDLSTRKDPNDISKSKVLDTNEKSGNSRYHWETIETCKEKKFLLLPRVINFDIIPDFCINLSEYSYSRRRMNGFVEYENIIPTYEFGYLLGAFLGDGCAKINTSTKRKCKNTNFARNTSGAMNFYFNITEKDIADKVSGCFERVFGYKPIVKESKKKNMILVVVRSNPIIRLFEELGKRNKKKLPDYLRCSNKEYCKGLYDGLLDSDGHYANDGRVGLANTSKSIIELFQWIHYMVNGFYPSCVEKIPPKEHHFGPTDNWKISYTARSVKRPEFNQTENYQVATINGMSETEEIVDTFDIEVDSQDHSFIANNAIVHNSLCTTRQVTGHGVPQLMAVEDCVRIRYRIPIGFVGDTTEIIYSNEYPDVAIISDGGVRKAGDVVKALAMGADAVMVGGMLAATIETAGEFIEEDGVLYKYFQGMASEEARAKYMSKPKIGVPAEGVSKKILYSGRSATKIIEDLCASVRVGLSYSGANNILELREKAVWMKVTGSGYIEGTPHKK